MRTHSFIVLSTWLTIVAAGCGQAPREHAGLSEPSTVISLESKRIDIRTPDIDIPESLRIRPGDVDAERVVLVKYPGPLDAPQDRDLRSVVETVYTYLPEYTYLVRMPAGMGLADLQRAAGAAWVGPYHPQYKLSRAVAELSPRNAPTDEPDAPKIVMIHAYPDVNVDVVVRRIRELGAQEVPGHSQGSFFSKIRLLLTPAEIVRLRESIAQIPEVFWIDIEGRRVLFNDTTIWVGQSGLSGGQTTPLFTREIYGQGQIVAVLDTGIDPDMCYFRDTALGQPPRNECNGGTVVDMNQRKVIAVNFLSPSECGGGIANNEWDNQDHGTHVAGTVAGDNFASPLVHDAGDGVAPGAKLVIQDGGYASNACAELPGIGCPVVDLNPIFQQTYDQGARIHSNSWGDQETASIQNDYTAASQDADEFMWNHKDFLILFASGNSGPGTASVSSPSTAKSVISVGSTQRGTGANSMSSFSSCGPTDDGRYKPEIVVPGSSIVSANSDNSTTTQNCNTRTMSGTSMATPGAAGLAALIRQYYTDGWYPSGNFKKALDGFTPSAALIRATMVNSGERVTNASPMPGNCQGWGRVTLDNALYFAGEARRLWIKDDATGFAQGSMNEIQNFKFTVHAGAMPLKATLAWTDYPSTPAALPHINNDLDLEVTGPGGTYLGNVLSQGESITGGNADRVNTLEQVVLNAPMPGEYVVSVRSFNVPNGPQPFALVVTGDASVEGSLGASCMSAVDCASNFCADGVCCNAACDAGACDACSTAAGANVDGTCRLLTGNSCDDGNACTQSDTCKTGVCTGANPVVCPMPDICHEVGVCDPMTGMCSNPEKPEGTACDDGDACTLNDGCIAGVCAGSSVNCTALDDCHDAGVCDPMTGTCSNPEKPEGAACDDGNGCTVSDSCMAGICMAGAPMDCVAPDECHEAGICDSMTGTCSSPEKPDGTACSIGQCIGGVCTAPSTSSSSSGGAGGNGGSGGMGTGGTSETGGAGGGGGGPALDIGDNGGCGCGVADAPERGLAWVGFGVLLAVRRRRSLPFRLLRG
ncbi:MAG: S8 family serine peptidase [Polyangiaceae bacterium]|nr:S8 family serine peptidase [Polyangiaceae bacterium]